jgi:hypothetical protein
MSEPNGRLASFPGLPVAVVGTAEINIQNCQSCGGSHKAVACRPYSKPNPPFTHHYSCPSTHDPIGLALLQQANDNKDVREVCHRILKELWATQGQPFIHVMFRLNKLGKVVGELHRFHMEVDEAVVAQCVFELDYMLRKASPLLKPVAPLPTADMKTLEIFGHLTHPIMVGGAAEAACEMMVAEVDATETPPPFTEGDPADEDGDDDPESDEGN